MIPDNKPTTAHPLFDLVQNALADCGAHAWSDDAQHTQAVNALLELIDRYQDGGIGLEDLYAAADCEPGCREIIDCVLNRIKAA